MKILVLVFLLSSMDLNAQEIEEPQVYNSMAGFTFVGDSNEGRTSNLNLQIALEPRLAFVISGGRSFSKSQTDTTSDTNFGSLGFQSMNRKYDFGLVFESWGTRDALMIRSARIPLAYNAEQFSIFISPKVGRLKIDYLNRTETMHASSLAIGAALYLPEPWVFRINAEKFCYEQSLDILANENFEYLFSDTTLSLSSALLESQAIISVGYDFGQWSLIVEATSAKSGIDDSESGSLALIASIELSPQWIGEVSAGGSSLKDVPQDETSKVSVLGFTATYLW